MGEGRDVKEGRDVEGGRDWRDDAACKGVTDLFFPDKDWSRAAEAKQICAECPVLDECKDFSTRYELDGIWAGLSVRQRRAIRRERQRRGEI